jgi:hypothetical protein
MKRAYLRRVVSGSYDQVASPRRVGFRHERAREGRKCDGSGIAADTADPRVIIGDAGEHKSARVCGIIQRMLVLFRGSSRKLREQVHQLAHESDQLRGDVTNRLQ